MKEALNNIWNAPAAEMEQALLTGLIVAVSFFAGLCFYMNYRFNKRRKEMRERFDNFGRKR